MTYRRILASVLASEIVAVTLPAEAHPLPPRRPVVVLRVYDGDTFTIAGRQGEIQIRIENIDAPEIGWR